MPYAADIHIDPALTTISIAYRNDGYIGDAVAPPVPVGKRSAQWFIYGKEHFKQRDDLVRPGGIAPEWTRSLSRDMYVAERHAQRQFVTDDEVNEADDPLNPFMDTTEFLTESCWNSREFAIINTVTNPAVVTQNLALSGTTQWSDYGNSVPFTNIRTAKSAVRLGALKEAGTMFLSWDAAQVLADHPSVLEHLKYTDPNSISTSGLPRVVRGLTVQEAGAFIDTANDGQPANMSTAWGKNALVAYVNPRPSLKSITFAVRMEAPDATTKARGFSTQRYRVEERHGEMVEVASTYVVKVIAPLAAYMYTTVYT